MSDCITEISKSGVTGIAQKSTHLARLMTLVKFPEMILVFHVVVVVFLRVKSH